MLRNTFCHIPGFGLKSERKLWSGGILSWDDVASDSYRQSEGGKNYYLRMRVLESIERLEEGDSRYFADTLPANQIWRIFPHFRDSVAYMDIETNGYDGPRGSITTIALYDGHEVRHYVKGINLGDFPIDILKYKMIVTYNGKCFDVPVVENYFGIKLHQAHIDLLHIMRSLGYKGGLKGCEKSLGIDRKELTGVNGYFAVLLWKEFRRYKDEKALETLLAYNILDAVNLERLIIEAYNQNLKETPFSFSHAMELPDIFINPFHAHADIIDKIKSFIDVHA